LRPKTPAIAQRYLRVFSCGKLFKGQAAFGTLRLLQNDVLMALAELGFNGAAVADRAALLPAFAAGRSLGATLAGYVSFALGGEQSLLQVAHLSQCFIQRGLQSSI
jgi:hypothetical protein